MFSYYFGILSTPIDNILYPFDLDCYCLLEYIAILLSSAPISPIPCFSAFALLLLIVHLQYLRIVLMTLDTVLTKQFWGGGRRAAL